MLARKVNDVVVMGDGGGGRVVVMLVVVVVVLLVVDEGRCVCERRKEGWCGQER